MELFHQRISGHAPVEIMRLDLLMQYYDRWGSGIAALRWSDPFGGGPLIEAHLVALLYGHILCTHQATRAELFARVGEVAARNVHSKGQAGFAFAPWTVNAGAAQAGHTLWPWLIVPADEITAPVVYSVVMKIGAPNATAPAGRWIEMEMSTGREEILAPSSTLIAIAGLSSSCDPRTRYLLARLLWEMNAFWVTPNMVAFYGEAQAYAAADATIHAPPFHIP